MQCVEAGLAVYSPHTAWDAVEGGVNTWCQPSTFVAGVAADLGRFGCIQSRQM